MLKMVVRFPHSWSTKRVLSFPKKENSLQPFPSSIHIQKVGCCLCSGRKHRQRYCYFGPQHIGKFVHVATYQLNEVCGKARYFFLFAIALHDTSYLRAEKLIL